MRHKIIWLLKGHLIWFKLYRTADYDEIYQRSHDILSMIDDAAHDASRAVAQRAAPETHNIVTHFVIDTEDVTEFDKRLRNMRTLIDLLHLYQRNPYLGYIVSVDNTANSVVRFITNTATRAMSVDFYIASDWQDTLKFLARHDTAIAAEHASIRALVNAEHRNYKSMDVDDAAD